MRALPFDWKDLADPIGAAVIPFVPLAFLAMPIETIVDDVAKLLL